MSSYVITALAILKVNWDLGKDYLETFLPLVVECIRKNTSNEVSLPELKKSINELFGLNIPLNPLRQILKRASKRGYLKREHGIFYRDKEACDKIGFQDVQRKVESIFDSIIKKLIGYVKEKYSKDWSQDEATNALYEFLRNNSISLIFSLAEDTEITRGDKSVGKSYIVADFISNARINDQQLLDDIEVIVKGNLLANAIYLPDVGQVKKQFRDTKVFLDTSIIVFSAGYAGPYRAAPCLELIELLKKNGAELCCFQKTYDEVLGILNACASRFKRGDLKDAYGPSIEYFIHSGKSASDIELMAVRLPKKLKTLGISVIKKPPYVKKYQIDEQSFEEALEKEIHYSNPKARIHDIDCISAIARLRRGRESIFPETSGALFVTSNSSLAKISRDFFKSDTSPGSVNFCITDYALGNLLWLKNPISAPNLPRKRLLADSYATIQPSEQLWKKYLIEIAKLEEEGTISADDYYILRYSMAAKSALMDLTQGDENVFCEGTLQEILEIVKENIKSDLRQSLEKEVQKRQLAESLSEESKQKDIRRRLFIRNKANRFALYFRKLVFIMFVLILPSGILLTFPWEFPKITTSWLSYLFSFFLFILLILTFLNLLMGVTVNTIMKRLESYIGEKVFNFIIHFYSLEDENQEK